MEWQADVTEEYDGRPRGKQFPTPADLAVIIARNKRINAAGSQQQFTPCNNCDAGWIRVFRLQGRPYDDLPDGNKWDLFMLEMHEQDLEAFWDRVYAAVEAGKLAISETKKHCLGDEPLLPSHND